MPDIATWKVVASVGAVVVAGAYLANSYRSGPPAASANRSGILGYLSSAEMPDSVALLAPPPKAGSVAMKRDEEARAKALSHHDTPRYTLAVADANRGQENTVAAFQCAYGIDINKKATPKLYQLLGRIRLDVRAASYPAKSHFKRPRPFVANNTQPCNGSDAQNVRNDGSYPSARGAVGFAYGAVLAALNPARAAQIKQRAAAFGRSRMICDEEWLSDVEAAAQIADATLKHIRGKPAFKNDFAAARAELAAALKSGAPPPNCRSETVALASR